MRSGFAETLEEVPTFAMLKRYARTGGPAACHGMRDRHLAAINRFR